MTILRLSGVLALVFGVRVVSTIAASPVQAPAEGAQVSAQQWSQEIWRLAMSRDQQSLDRHFQMVPEDATNQVAAARFRNSIELHQANGEKARAKREEGREKALVELREHVAANDLSKALRSAVTVQTLSDDLETAFDNADIVKIIDWAAERIPLVQTEMDWLLAQELLFYLRTLYEDTGRVEQYQKYHDELEAVNRRVSLLAQYAPHQLHELRSRRAVRLGEKPLGEYRPNEAADWMKRTQDIGSDMLKGALRTAAKEHIEANGWRPLLRGGLEELRLLATTASLDETFPKLADPALVQQWVKHIDDELLTLSAAKDTELDNWKLAKLLDDLVRANEKTIGLERGVLYREFGDGALYELDEFSEIIWPDKLPRFKQATEGAFVGVGILIRHNDAQEIVVINPLEGTPAYFGGVKPNDKIAEVDGESTVGWSLNEAVDRITGTKATQVTIGLKRDGVEEVIPVKLTRDEIKLRSVMGWWKRDLRADGSPEWDWYIDPASRIAYIRLTQFTDDSYGDLLDAWREINAHGAPSGLILDLRYNPGGLLTSAVSISNMFVSDGVIVSGEDKDGKRVWADQKADPTKSLDGLDGMSIIVLINQGSASASEIVSGCLQAHQGAVIVGERSFGKGSVQTVHPTAHNARLKLTTQYYRLPATIDQIQNNEPGRLVHKRIGATVWGVDPDIIVKMTPQQVTEALDLRQASDVIPQDENGKLLPKSDKRADINRMVTEGIDPQLETALLILQARALGGSASQERHALKNQ